MKRFVKSRPIIISLIVIIIVFAGFGTYRFIQHNTIPNHHNKEYSTGYVSLGSVFQIVEAEGETAAENEVLILCPNNGIVQKVLRLPGNKVSKDEVILALDKTELSDQLSNANDQLDLLNNKLYKLNLNARTTKIDLEHDIEVKKLRIASLKAELNDQNELLDVGGISQARIDKTKQEIVLAEKELVRSTQKHRIRLKQLKAEEDGIQLQISMKEKQIASLKEQIKKMVIQSPGTGIILEVRARKGENKRKNEILVRISEETRLKIKGEISDRHSSLMRNGGKVFAVVGNDRISGVIGNIQPELENDKIQFDVFLENPQNENLKVNQKVKLLLVKEESKNALRVNKGEYFETSRSFCYVLENDEIEKRNIKTGLKGIDYIEITDGLEPGDVVVNSNIVRSKKNKKAKK